jgi:hypothetical protein
VAGSHSRSRKPRRGARFPEDPDRRVKYVLRWRRKGESVEPQTRLVRRGRKPDTRALAPGQAQTERREQHRRARRAVVQDLTEEVKERNAEPELSQLGEPDPAEDSPAGLDVADQPSRR